MKFGEPTGEGMGSDRRRLHRRVGEGEYARGDLGRDEAQGDLRHHRPAHDRAFLRRLGLRAEDAQTRSPAEIGYAKGVPMGGDLRAAPQGKAPTFLVAALKDPIGANLDRIQIIKGWVDQGGKHAGEDLRRRLGRCRQAQARRRRQAAAGRQHGRRRERHLDQHYRRARADRGLDGSGVRSRAARLLLRARARDPDAALDRL